MHGKEKPYSVVNLAYSSECQINKCNWLKLDLSYSSLEIEESNALMVSNLDV